MMKLPTRRPFVWLPIYSKWINIAMTKDKYIAKPPNLGISLLCIFRLFGLSIAPILQANIETNGVNIIDKKVAVINAEK